MTIGFVHIEKVVEGAVEGFSGWRARSEGCKGYLAFIKSMLKKMVILTT